MAPDTRAGASETTKTAPVFDMDVTQSMHAVRDNDHDKVTSVLSVFESDHSDSISDGEDPFSRVFADTPGFKRHRQRSLKLPSCGGSQGTSRRVSFIEDFDTTTGGDLPEPEANSSHIEHIDATVPPPAPQPASSASVLANGTTNTQANQKGTEASALVDEMRRLRDEMRAEGRSKDMLHARIMDLEAHVEVLNRQLLTVQGTDHPITPELIPSGPKEYYRLQLHEVDGMGQVALANIVKNMLILFNTPLSKIQQFIPALAKILNQEDHYLDFANKVHETLFEEPLQQGVDEDAVRVCLDKMVAYIDRGR